MTKKTGYSTVSKVLVLQVLIVIVISVAFLIFHSKIFAISAIVGGLTAFLPNLYFAYRLSLEKSGNAKKIVHSFYSGETRKILMTVALFAIAFQVPNIQFFPLMVCFVAVLSVFWLALILFAHEFELESVRKDG